MADRRRAGGAAGSGRGAVDAAGTELVIGETVVVGGRKVERLRERSLKRSPERQEEGQLASSAWNWKEREARRG